MFVSITIFPNSSFSSFIVSSDSTFNVSLLYVSSGISVFIYSTICFTFAFVLYIVANAVTIAIIRVNSNKYFIALFMLN